MAYCINCGQQLPEGAEFCTECGVSINNTADNHSETIKNIPEKQCPQCGEKMPEDMFYCLNCGYKFRDKDVELDEVVHQVQMLQGTWKNKWISLTLCFFLGVFGAHKFYEGKNFWGVLYLLTFGFFGLGWFVDIIRLAFKPNPYKAK